MIVDFSAGGKGISILLSVVTFSSIGVTSVIDAAASGIGEIVSSTIVSSIIASGISLIATSSSIGAGIATTSSFSAGG